MNDDEAGCCGCIIAMALLVIGAGIFITGLIFGKMLW